MNLTITDRESGKSYRVPEDLKKFLSEHLPFDYSIEDIENEPIELCYNGISISGTVVKGWHIPYYYSCEAAGEETTSDEFYLDPSRFQISFEGLIEVEKVREAIENIVYPKEDEMLESMRERGINSSAFKWIIAICYATITETKNELCDALGIPLSEPELNKETEP